MIRRLVVWFVRTCVVMLESLLRITLRATRGDGHAGPTRMPSGSSPKVPKARADGEVDAAVDLAFVGTTDLFEEIAGRFDGCALVVFRRSDHGGDGGSVVVLSRNLADTPAYLRSVADLTAAGQVRDLREGDL